MAWQLKLSKTELLFFKLDLVHVQIGSGQVMKSEPLSYPSIKRSHVLIGHHVLLCAVNT